VFAAIAAGGGTAVTIGPPSTTADATALVACVVAMAVAEVDAVIGMTDCTVVVMDVGNVGAVADGKESNAAEATAEADSVDVVTVVVVVAVTVVVAATSSLATGASTLVDATAPVVDCFLGKRGDDLTDGRLTVGFAETVGLGPATASVDGCGRLVVLGDLSGSGDLGGTGLRGVDGNFLRGDDLTAAALLAIGMVGGFPTTEVFRPLVAPIAADGCLVDEPDVRLPAIDKSLVDAESRFLSVVLVGGPRLLSTIRGSDD